MSDYLIGLRNTPSQVMARQRIEAMIDLRKLYTAIDADPAISGAGVVYIDANFNVVTLREFTPICSIRPKRMARKEIGMANRIPATGKAFRHFPLDIAATAYSSSKLCCFTASESSPTCTLNSPGSAANCNWLL